MITDYNPYTLPTIDFVGGETQELSFNIYARNSDKPFNLSECRTNFSLISYANKNGKPVLSKSMESARSASSEVDNLLKVKLLSSETVMLSGKYIYQIIIQDEDGDTEIPKQGIIYITNNINKDFIRQ